MLAIYSSLFNVAKMRFDWKGALSNWLTFLNNEGQLSIVINTSDDDSPTLVRKWLAAYQAENPWCHTKITVTDASIPYDDPEFDGKLKALALSHCTEPYCILLDCDERIVPSTRHLWVKLAIELQNDPRIDAFLIPVVDLFGDEQHYRNPLNSKWYLHRNSPNITRGVVGFAYRANGSIDTSRSDTSEAIYLDTKGLVRATPIVNPSFPHFLIAGILHGGETAFVYHLGALDQQQRIRQSTFWAPVWANRNKSEQEAIPTLDDLSKVPRFKHDLPTWRTDQ